MQVEGTDDEKTNFYTSLYYLYIQPNNIADTDGRYVFCIINMYRLLKTNPNQRSNIVKSRCIGIIIELFTLIIIKSHITFCKFINKFYL